MNLRIWHSGLHKFHFASVSYDKYTRDASDTVNKASRPWHRGDYSLVWQLTCHPSTCLSKPQENRLHVWLSSAKITEHTMREWPCLLLRGRRPTRTPLMSNSRMCRLSWGIAMMFWAWDTASLKHDRGSNDSRKVYKYIHLLLSYPIKNILENI